MPRDAKRRALLNETLDAAATETGATTLRQPFLTILHHPMPARVGEEAELQRADNRVSRTTPDFNAPYAADPWPLADPFISRRPAIIEPTKQGGVTIRRPSADAVEVVADGHAVEASVTFDRDAFEAGIVITLGRRIVLLLHTRRRRSERIPYHGLVGESEAIEDVRQAVLRVADLDVPVLLRGGTGTGKELVAQALHDAGARDGRAFLGVNMGALAPSVSASELFGHVKGAFTGADGDKPGYFVRADGGSLFLDEIGETPVEVQVMLLRVLENGVVQPVGGTREQTVDVRLIAATDANLEQQVAGGSFRSALLHRLSGYEIVIPPLARRRDDIGRLFIHFLRAQLETTGEAARLDIDEPERRPWIGASLMDRLCRYDWPGNVRQLRNVTRQLAISSRGESVMRIDASIERLLGDEPTASERKRSAPPPSRRASAPPDADRRKPSDVTDEELLAALKANRYRLAPTATQLRITRSSLHMLIDKNPHIRKAKDLSHDELLACYNELGGDVDAMADRLQVSPRGLGLRIKELR